MGALDALIVRVMPWVPRVLVQRVSARYIAGATLESALETVTTLNQGGLRATVDLLGERVQTSSQTERATQEYLDLLHAIHRQKLQSQASVKLTQLGLELDRALCIRHLESLVHKAEAIGNLVTIDMEDSSCTDRTLEIFSNLRKASSHVGAVLQARLRRSRGDLESILPLEPNVRICKGIYLEPERIAYQDRDEVRSSFLDLVEGMLKRPSFVGIATHDEVLIQKSLELLKRDAVSSDRYEFQMLLGVREGLRHQLLAAGHPVRVYVPYGEDWYAYSLRRLQENPAIAGHVIRNLFDRRNPFASRRV